MKSIGKLVSAAVLMLALTMTASAAFAQEAVRGGFTLTHDVKWQGATVPAGDYRFWVEPNAGLGLLILQKTSGSRTGFMVPIHGTESAERTDQKNSDLLVLVPRADGSFVSMLKLPTYGVTLRFTVPSEGAMASVARATSGASAMLAAK